MIAQTLEVPLHAQIRAPFNSRIASTVEAIAAAASPVARSCHIGNNLAHAWGWLAMTENTQFVQFDHARYGVDKNCVPWTVLADDGLVDACFNHRGQRLAEFEGSHVSQQISTIPLGPRSNLALSVYGVYKGEDLIARHCRVASELSRIVNGSTVTFESEELLAMQDVLVAVVEAAFEDRALLSVFPRWMRSSRKGYVTMRKIKKFEYGRGPRVTITDMSDAQIFAGSLDDLFRDWFDGLAAVVQRLRSGARVADVAYPWSSIQLIYLIDAARQFMQDPNARDFWHAGGAESQYYINQQKCQVAVRELSSILVRSGHLPRGAVIHMVPTLSCQLFATTVSGLGILEDLLEYWHTILRSDDRYSRWGAMLAASSNPLRVIERIWPQLPTDLRVHLREALRAFNAEDLNHLPVGHVSTPRFPSYEKYGMAQDNIYEASIRFPTALWRLTWTEAELLVKLLAETAVDEWR